MIALPYTLKHLAKALDILRLNGIDGIIIGNTCTYIVLHREPIEDDVDLFVTSLSPLIDEELIRSKAAENGWSTGLTELGTLALVLNIEGADIRFDLYENIHDFYIPNEALDVCRRSITVEGITIPFVAPECWMVFKARRGSNRDMLEIGDFLRRLEAHGLKLDLSLIKKVAQLYEDEARFIFDRLRSLGLRL